MQAWAQPAECALASSYFKLERSKEEIVHVNIEAHRLRTAMHDGERDLASHIQWLETEDPALAHQVQRLFQAQLSVNRIHHHRLNILEGLEGFTGESGVGVCKGMVMDQGLETE